MVIQCWMEGINSQGRIVGRHPHKERSEAQKAPEEDVCVRPAAGNDVIMTVVVIEIHLLAGRGALVDDSIGVVFGRHNNLSNGTPALL